MMMLSQKVKAYNTKSATFFANFHSNIYLLNAIYLIISYPIVFFADDKIKIVTQGVQ